MIVVEMKTERGACTVTGGNDEPLTWENDMTFRGFLAVGILACGLMAGAAAEAAPLAAGATAALQPHSGLSEHVQFRGRGYGGYGGYYAPRGYYGRGYGGGYRNGAWPWVGLAAGVAAGAIIYNYAYRPRVGYYYDTYDYDGPYYFPQNYRGDPREICARNFKSFEWDTGRYTTYGGQRRVCHYLQ